MRRGAPHLSGADLVELRKRLEALRISGRQLRDQGMAPSDIAQGFRLSERAVHEILSDAPSVSIATMQELGRRKRHA